MEHEKSKQNQTGFSGKKEDEFNISSLSSNALHIVNELDWLQKILTRRTDEVKQELSPARLEEFPPPSFGQQHSPYSTLVEELDLPPHERLLLICALAPHLSPELLTTFFKKPNSLDIELPQFGGYIDSTFHTFVPTFQTVLYLLAGPDQTNAMYYQISLMDNGSLIKEQIVNLVSPRAADFDVSIRQQTIEIAQEYLYFFISGKKPMPDFGRAFPASLITTGMDWDQLVISQGSMAELQRIKRWGKSGQKLAKFTKNKISSGFTCLFYGPPGTGKSLAARLIGKSMERDVFRIDLSMIVSKYIGETEKNLAHLFDRAEGKNWILFFDEADALFGKRTNISDAKDKWANLEMSYLLQRMEEYEGITILATNLKNNLDHAMNRRFQSVVYFGRPNFEQRREQWNRLLPDGFDYDNIDMDKLAMHDLTGGNISNILKAACLEAFHKGENKITSEYLIAGIMREYTKEGRSAS